MICYDAIVAEVGFYLIFGLLGWGLLARLPAGGSSPLVWITLFCVLAALLYVFFLFVVALATTGGYAPGQGSCGTSRVAFLGFWSMLVIVGFYAFALWQFFTARRELTT